MSMSIRPPATWLDANTNAAVDFKVYISQPNTDPKDPSKQLSITDSASGEVVSNYFVINPDGYAKNQNGQPVLPIIQEQEYAILFEAVGGGQQYAYPHVKGDAFGLTGGGSGAAMVDAVFNNFPAAQVADLTEFNLIFIQSKEAGWEATAEGPEYSYYAFYTGGVGAPSTGTFDLFYDSEGNEWKISENSQLPLTNEAAIAVNTPAIAANTSSISEIESLMLKQIAGNWSLKESDALNLYQDLTFGLDTFVCVGRVQAGNTPLIKTASRGVAWSTQTPVGVDALNGVTSDGSSLFVASGLNGRILTSSDSLAWTDRPNGMSSTLKVAYGAGLFVAVGSSGGAGGEIWSSPDGITWTERLAGTGVANDSLFKVIFNNGLFVAVGGSTLGAIRTSPDGVTWTSRVPPIEVTGAIGGVTWDGSNFIAVSKNIVISSPTGTSWTAISTVDSSLIMQEIAYGGGLYIMSGATGGKLTLLSSEDSLTWTNQGGQLGIATSVNDIIYQSGVFIACAGTGINSSFRAWSGS